MKAEYDFSNAKRGAVAKAPVGKTRITIRLDDDVIEWFRAQADEAGGGNYQTSINNALRDVMLGKAGIEDTLRRVVREELGRRRRSRSQELANNDHQDP